MRKLFAISALAGLMAVLGLSSNAQDFDPAIFKIMRPAMQIINSNPARLLMSKDVQKDLKMDDDQVKDLTAKVGMQLGGFGGPGGGPGGGGKERMAKLMDKLKDLKDVPEDKLEEKIREVFKEEIEGPMKEVQKVLKPEQVKRLYQIGRQQGGIAILTSPDTVKELKVTDEQKTKLREISAEADKDIGELIQAAGGFMNITAETREKMATLRKEAADKGEDVLTKEQKETWKELKGEPFTGKIDQFRGPRPKKEKD